MNGHIRQRSPGSYELRYRAAGKTVTSTFRGGKREADRELRRLLSLVDENRNAITSKMTMAQWFDRWLAAIRPEIGRVTHDRYSRIVAAYLVPAFGHIRLVVLRAADIQAAYSAWAEGGRRDGRDGPLAGSTRRLMARVLGSAMRRAVELQLIDHDPTAPLRRRLPARDTREMAVLDASQRNEALGLVLGTVYRVPFMLALATGARRGEICALRWRHIDLDRGTVRIADNMTQLHRKLVVGPTKSGKARTVTLPSIATEELRRRRIEQAEELLRLGARIGPNTFVCAWPDGSPLKPDVLSNYAGRLFARMGLNLHFHSLRHTHATELLLSGVHPKVAQERLGHASVAMTLDIYSHVAERLHDDAAERIDAVLRGL